MRVCTAGNFEIGDEGAIRIAEGLEKNISLKDWILDLMVRFLPIHYCISWSFLLEAFLSESLMMREMHHIAMS